MREDGSRARRLSKRSKRIPQSTVAVHQWITLSTLAAGHEDIEIEQVIAVRDEFVVVEKDGVAGLVADADDPRA